MILQEKKGVGEKRMDGWICMISGGDISLVSNIGRAYCIIPGSRSIGSTLFEYFLATFPLLPFSFTFKRIKSSYFNFGGYFFNISNTTSS